MTSAPKSVVLFAVVAFAACVLPSESLWAHQGHSNPAPWEACEGSRLTDTCSWQDAEGATYRGTCREMSEHLICVRNKPIEPPSAYGKWAAAFAASLVLLLIGYFGRRRR